MKNIVLILVLSVVINACAPAFIPTHSTTPAPPTETPIPPTATFVSSPDPKALASELDAIVLANNQAGLYDGAVLVAQNGQVLLSKGYGMADREKKIPNNPQTKFQIASITKQFTAMAILILQQKGKLNVEDKMCDYITNCPELFKSIKIRHLLTHSSGIPNATQYSIPDEPMVSKYATLLFQPGEQFRYQDVAYNLAGRIIETVSGQTYASFIKQNIFEPLGMSNTGVDNRKLTDLAKGYTEAKGDVALLPVGGMFAEGSMYSTVEDMYRWDQALYTDELLPQSSLKAMFSPQMAVPDGQYYGGLDGSKGWSYGFGWFIAPKEKGYVLHGGVIYGFRSEIRRYIDDKTVIILLANQEAVNLTGTSDAIANKLLRTGKK